MTRFSPDAARAAGDVLERRAAELKSLTLAQLLRDVAHALHDAHRTGKGFGAGAAVIECRVTPQADLFDGGSPK